MTYKNLTIKKAGLPDDLPIKKTLPFLNDHIFQNKKFELNFSGKQISRAKKSADFFEAHKKINKKF